MNFETGDLVNLPIFWKGVVIESYWSKVIVQFENKVFWLKTVSKDLFDADKKRLTKKNDLKKIEKYNDEAEQYYHDLQRDDAFITNDELV